MRLGGPHDFARFLMETGEALLAGQFTAQCGVYAHTANRVWHASVMPIGSAYPGCEKPAAR